jgi:hypothetical protein
VLRISALKKWVSLWTVEELYKHRVVLISSKLWRILRESDFALSRVGLMKSLQNFGVTDGGSQDTEAIYHLLVL